MSFEKYTVNIINSKFKTKALLVYRKRKLNKEKLYEKQIETQHSIFKGLKITRNKFGMFRFLFTPKLSPVSMNNKKNISEFNVSKEIDLKINNNLEYIKT